MSRARILADYVSSGDELAATTTVANAALPKAGGSMTGAITTNSTFDGIDIAVRDALHAPKANPTFTGTVAIPNVANLETAVVANTAKVTNATHSGQVTGSTALTIANDAVDSQHYAADSIDTEHYAPASVDTTAMAASVIGVKPHIIPGVLYPAVAGNDLDGTDIDTSHGSTYTYGTAHADGRKYYYTDIKGSKPIKDPRIGAHFGSQRHKFKSIQLLEQETATHGKNIYSTDGREWLRMCGISEVGNTDWGNYIRFSDGATADAFIEIVGYFSDANYIGLSYTSGRHFQKSVDGGSETLDTAMRTTVVTPLLGRYVDAGAVHNLGLGQTLGIHTLKIRNADSGTTEQDLFSWGIELIAQDTTSTTTKSQIQIPSQNVVSYGKKFTVAETKHYNPFAFKTDGSTAWASGAHNGTAWPIGTGSSTNIDTATSLGLAAWVSTNYYYPYNGGRVVKWIASDGTIKTSVNMMPPNARSIGNSSSLTNATAKANASIANNTFYPTMEAGTIDHSQAEVAKTYHWREFGNGAANGGAESGSYADASMLNANYDDIAYVMDDGLTSLSADDANDTGSAGGMHVQSDGDHYYITFIGTGISYKDLGGTHGGTDHYEWYIDGVEVKDIATGHVHLNSFVTIAQNLPYGTHILKVVRVTANTYGQRLEEISFHQPKMPPIPEDAVVIADYMLMADHVVQTDAEPGQISKGVRHVSASRDIFYDSSSALTAGTGLIPYNSQYGFRGMVSGSATVTAKLPFFGTSAVLFAEGTDDSGYAISLGGASQTLVKLDNSVNNDGDAISMGSVTLGNITVDTTVPASGFAVIAYDIASPIHTSSHYQTFETPFLHELVGGDRNMEQTNLVVTPDGKTWDEVSRDVSYISPTSRVQLRAITTMNETGTTNVTHGLNRQRGAISDWDHFLKDWVFGYNRIICLKSGEYVVYYRTLLYGANKSGAPMTTKLNGSMLGQAYHDGTAYETGQLTIPFRAKRGDYIQIYGYMWDGLNAYFSIRKV